MKRLHIGVTEDMHRCVKLFATYNDITANDVISKAITLYLQNQTEYEVSPLLKEEIKLLNKE